jgi:uncharacterized protein YukE
MDFLGDPGSIDGVAGELTSAQGTLSRVEGDVTAGASRLVPASWQGGAAAAFQGHVSAEASTIGAIGGVASQMASILDRLASELRQARQVAGQAEDIAHAHGLTVGADGQIGSPPLVLAPDRLHAAEQARGQAQAIMSQAIQAADTARAHASSALGGLSVPPVQAGATPQAVRAWALAAAPGQPGSPSSLAEDLWNALRRNVIPPDTMGGVGYGLWGLGRGLSGLGVTSSWMSKITLGRFAPRNALGQFVSPEDLSWWETALKSSQGKNWVANPGLADTGGAWATAGKWGGRAGAVLAFGGAALNQWMQDNGRSDLSTSERIGRTAYRSAVAGGAAWGGAVAGAEAGAAIGTLVGGPVGTVIGGFVGGVAGGVIGSGVGNWVVDHTVDAVGHGTEAAVHAVGDAGSTAIHAVGSGLSDAGHAVGSVIDDINPF